MAGFDHRHHARRPPVAVARDRNAGEARGGKLQLVEIMPLRGLDHRARGLAGGEQDEAAFRGWRGQVRGQARGRMRRRDRGVEQVFEEGARRHGPASAKRGRAT